MTENISRRGFLQGAVLAAGGVAAAGLAGCAAENATTTEGSTSAESLSQTGSGAAETSDGGRAFRPAQGEGIPVRAGYAGPDATPIDPVEVPDAWDDEVDVVVVGTGFGGLAAATKCAQGGLKVVALEKAAQTGGAGRGAFFNICHTGGSKVQNENAEPGTMRAAWDPDDDNLVKAKAAEWQRYYQYSVKPDLMCRVIQNGPKYYDWLCEQDGMDLACIPFVSGPFEAFVNKRFVDNGYNSYYGNSDIIDTLTADCEAEGVEIMLSTPCSALVAEGGRVVGVKAEGPQGEIYIKANKGVLLAAGGFGMNHDLLEQYIPTGYLFATVGGPDPSHTGEAFRMGLGMGADFSGFNSFSNWDGGSDRYWGAGNGNYCSSYLSATAEIYSLPIIGFNKMGDRVPNSSGFESRKTENPEDMPCNTPFIKSVCEYYSGPDHRRYMIWDSTWDFDTLDNLPERYAGDTLKATWESLAPEIAPMVTPTWQDDFQMSLDAGDIVKVDTIEELEELWQFAPGVLTDAIKRWNEDCEFGEDRESLLPYPSDALIPVLEPPFYGMIIGSQITKTNCGLRVTSKMEVVDNTPQHQVIPGLYASWSTAGGFCGESNFLDYGQCSPMGSVGLSGTSGFIAARALLGELDS